eukprot:4056521-Amphidinium_carterae.1
MPSPVWAHASAACGGRGSRWSLGHTFKRAGKSCPAWTKDTKELVAGSVSLWLPESSCGCLVPPSVIKQSACPVQLVHIPSVQSSRLALVSMCLCLSGCAKPLRRQITTGMTWMCQTVLIRQQLHEHKLTGEKRVCATEEFGYWSFVLVSVVWFGGTPAAVRARTHTACHIASFQIKCFRFFGRLQVSKRTRRKNGCFPSCVTEELLWMVRRKSWSTLPSYGCDAA